MQFDLGNLLSDTALSHRLVREMAVIVDSRDGEIERLQLIIRSCSERSSGIAPNALMPINWRSRLKTSTATLPASGRAPR